MELFLDGALICMGLVGVLFVGLTVFAIHGRRHESRPDPEGVRTLASFRGGPCGPEEHVEIVEEGPAAAGGDLLRALVDELAAEDVQPSDPVSRDGHGWGVLLSDSEAYLQVGLRSAGELDGRELDPDTEREWLLTLVDASGGGPGPRELLPPIHRALERVPGVDSIQWFPRHRFDEEDTAGHPFPVDEPTEREG